MKTIPWVSSVMAVGVMMLGHVSAQTTSPDGGRAQVLQAHTRQAEMNDREATDEPSQPHPDNHGMVVSTTARTTELTGQAKGAAVSTVASEGRSARRGNSSVGRAHRPVRTARATRPGERSVTNRAIGRSAAAQGRRGRAH